MGKKSGRHTKTGDEATGVSDDLLVGHTRVDNRPERVGQEHHRDLRDKFSTVSGLSHT